MRLDNEAQRTALLGILEQVSVRGPDSSEHLLNLVNAIKKAELPTKETETSTELPAPVAVPWWKSLFTRR